MDMCESNVIPDVGMGTNSAATRRDVVKTAAAAAVVGSVLAAPTTAPAESVQDARLTADLEKYRTLGAWVEKPADLQPQLEGDINADVVIVGAGFAGLNAALALSRHGAKVVVLEREFAGFGASGRNAGYLAGAMSLEYDLFLKKLGDEKGRKIVTYYEEAVNYVERKLKEYEIDCDYNQSGLIRAAVHPSQEDNVRKSMETGARLGFQSEFLDQAAMRARGIPPAFLFGEYCPRGGTLDPGKYVTGLRRSALRAGVSLYENTPLLSYADGRTVRAQTPRGSVSAPVLMFATNAYSPQMGVIEDKVIPIRVSAIETEPLSPTQLASLAWPRREGIVTAHTTMESHRLTARNTLLVTTKRLHYPYGSQTPNVPDYDHYRALREALLERFPTLRDIALRACWSGYVSLANDALPVVGAMGAHQNIFYSAGCSGHGVAAQSMVGHMIGERIRGVEDPILAGMRHDTPSMLPEPLRWCVVTGGLSVANMMDEHVNNKVRATVRRG